MAVDLSALAPATFTAQALANIILVTPNKNIGYVPQLVPGTTPNGIQGFLFDYEGENSITLDSDITDHYVEDNTAVQDQIALRPEMITVHGYIAELNDVVPPLLEPLKSIADKLTTLSPFLPAISATALVAYNEAKFGYDIAAQALSASVSAWNSIGAGGAPVQNKQQKAFQQFYGYWRNRTLFTLQTPWAVWQDMAIKTIRAVQDEDTRVISSFEITFKRMRYAQTITQLNVAQLYQGRLLAQGSETVDQGVSTPVDDIGLTDALTTSGLGVA